MHYSQCDTCAELAQKTIRAVQTTYGANGNDRAIFKNAERVAAFALETHIKEHDCRASLPGSVSRSAGKAPDPMKSGPSLRTH